jgi:hypothetical protein
MLVDRDYMLKKPSGPSAPKLFLDTQVVPVVVNALGGAEVALHRVSARTGVRPAVLLAGIAGVLAYGLVQIWIAATEDFDDAPLPADTAPPEALAEAHPS